MSRLEVLQSSPDDPQTLWLHAVAALVRAELTSGVCHAEHSVLCIADVPGAILSFKAGVAQVLVLMQPLEITMHFCKQQARKPAGGTTPAKQRPLSAARSSKSEGDLPAIAASGRKLNLNKSAAE